MNDTIELVAMSPTHRKKNIQARQVEISFLSSSAISS